MALVQLIISCQEPPGTGNKSLGLSFLIRRMCAGAGEGVGDAPWQLKTVQRIAVRVPGGTRLIKRVAL